MTKLRPPLSIEQALARIAGQLPEGFDTMAQVTGRSASLVRKWGDPDREEQIPVDCAIALDLAFQEHGGRGCPIHSAYTAKLEIGGATRFEDSFELLRGLTTLVKEGGEAHSALARACLPGAGVYDVQLALRELSDNYEAIPPLIQLLQGMADSRSRPRERDPPD